MVPIPVSVHRQKGSGNRPVLGQEHVEGSDRSPGRHGIGEDSRLAEGFLQLHRQRLQLFPRPDQKHLDIRLFLDFGSTAEREVPDPYYGGASGFDHVLDLLEDATRGFLAHLQCDDD